MPPCPGNRNTVTMRRANGSVMFTGTDATFEIGPPVAHGRRFERGVCFTTIRDWYERGLLILAVYPELTAVSILDRSPLVLEVEESSGESRRYVELREGVRRPASHWVSAYGWMYGYRWLYAPEEEACGAYHLPAAIFEHLPDCQFPVIAARRRGGSGDTPRWRTPEMAAAAMNVAAWNWAVAASGRAT